LIRKEEIRKSGNGTAKKLEKIAEDHAKRCAQHSPNRIEEYRHASGDGVIAVAGD
jgi:hypothetical protein